MAVPKYNPSEVVYLKESAALGFLEAVRISTIIYNEAGWLYTVRFTGSQPTAGSFYGDRRSLINGVVVHYTEDELVNQCTALRLAEANVKRVYDQLRAQRLAMCPDDVTGTG